MIYGLLGFRTLAWNRLAGGNYGLVSPIKTGFVWKQPLVWAECKSCPKDSEGHVKIQYSCTCGIYAGLDLDIALDYRANDTYVVVVAEALDSNLPEGGNIWAHKNGWTAPGARALFAVNIYDRTNIATMAVADKWHMKILTFRQAEEIVRYMWKTIIEEKAEYAQIRGGGQNE